MSWGDRAGGRARPPSSARVDAPRVRACLDVPLATSPAGASAKEAMFLCVCAECNAATTLDGDRRHACWDIFRGSLEPAWIEIPFESPYRDSESAGAARISALSSSAQIHLPILEDAPPHYQPRRGDATIPRRSFVASRARAGRGETRSRSSRSSAHARFHAQTRAMPSAGVDNTQRRKWDKDEYAARAAEREKAEDAVRR